MSLRDKAVALAHRIETEIQVLEQKIKDGVVTVEDLLGIKSAHGDLAHAANNPGPVGDAAAEGPAEQASTALPGEAGVSDTATAEPTGEAATAETGAETGDASGGDAASEAGSAR